MVGYFSGCPFFTHSPQGCFTHIPLNTHAHTGTHTYVFLFDPTSVMLSFFSLSFLLSQFSALGLNKPSPLLSSSLHLSASFPEINVGESITHAIHIHLPINLSASRILAYICKDHCTYSSMMLTKIKSILSRVQYLNCRST